MTREFIKGYGIPLLKNNIDTDQIIPARFCYEPKRTGYKDALFGNWREDPSFILNNPDYNEASILIAGYGFATGSSREYAVWAIKDYGFKVVIAKSFGEIFYKNAILNDVLPLKVSTESINIIWEVLTNNPKASIFIDLIKDIIKIKNYELSIFIDPQFKKKYLLNEDEISLTLKELESIRDYEKKRTKYFVTTK